MNRGAWWATVHGVAKSQTLLQLLSTSTHKHNIYTHIYLRLFSIIDYYKILNIIYCAIQ